MSDGDFQSHYTRLFQIIRDMFEERLRTWRVDLSQTTGAVPANQLPATGNSGTGYTTANHDHTGSGAAGDGGALSGALVDSWMDFDDQSTPADPDPGTKRLYAKSDGLYYLDDASTEVGPLGEGGGIPTSRVITAGAGLTGGGDLTADRTFDIGAGTGITVNANDVAVTTSAAFSWTGQHTHSQEQILNGGAKFGDGGLVRWHDATLGELMTLIAYYLTGTSFGDLMVSNANADSATLNLKARSWRAGSWNTVDIAINAALNKVLVGNAGLYVANHVQANAGVSVGSVTTASTGEVAYSSNLRPNRGGTAYTAYAVVPLTSPLTHTDYAGDTLVTGTYTWDTSAWGAPAGIKMALVQIFGNWAAAGSGNQAGLRPAGTATNMAILRSQAAGIINDMTVWVPCDSNGDIDLVVAGATMSNMTGRIWGYAI